MRERKLRVSAILLHARRRPGILLWAGLSHSGVFPKSAFPSPLSVVQAVGEEYHRGLVDNAVVSVFRVTVGFLLSVLVGVPMGLWLGLSGPARQALLPIVNFFRSLSPLAWSRSPFSGSAGRCSRHLPHLYGGRLPDHRGDDGGRRRDTVGNLPRSQSLRIHGTGAPHASNAARHRAAGDHLDARDGRAVMGGSRRRGDARRR